MIKTLKKLCRACGEEAETTTDKAQFVEDGKASGWYFHCKCGSTLFVPAPKEKSE